MLTQSDYESLEKRVAEGKKFLEGKWANQDRETREWIRIWFALADQLFLEMQRRGLFGSSKTVTVDDAMAHFEQIKQDAIDRGLIKADKGRKKKKEITGENGHPLFAASS